MRQILFAIAVFILTAGSSGATPFISMQASELCSYCHINPSGGMMRNANGIYYCTKTLPRYTVLPENVESHLGRAKGDMVSFGGDFRLLLLSREEKDTVVFPMQADIYINVGLLKHLSFFSQFGLQRGGNPAFRETFGMVKALPYGAYIKAGKFLPPYGHRVEDHTAFIRDKTGLGHDRPGSYYAGVEAGADPGSLFFKASYFNEDLTPAAASDSSRRGASGLLGWHDKRLRVGVSYMRVDNFENGPVLTIDRGVYGVFGGLRPKDVPYLERLTYLFEYDIRTDGRTYAAGREDLKADIMFNELSIRLIDGLYAKARYETFSPDNQSEEGLRRFVAGIDAFPAPFTELNLMYRINEEDNEIANDEILLVAHIWF